LSSGRTNEDIQSELVEIMGFEGDGLSLVEDLLKPGARELVLKNGGKVCVLPIQCES
jgi:antiviral helicase SLH1